MNERIRQLAADAGYPDYMTYGQDKVLEKFAEMIVRECARVADSKRDTSAGCGYVTYTDGQRIKKHFGIKE